MDLDAGISLVPPHHEVQGRYGQNLETQEGFGNGQEVSTIAQVSTASLEVTTADAKLNTASTFVSTTSPQRHADTTGDDLTLIKTLMKIRKSATKDKVAANEDFVQQLQAGKKCSEEDLPMKLVELVNQRNKFSAQQRAEAKRNKLMTLSH
ncbi:hypothetical protein Tco_0067473 [Tanacetum coccineum]